MIFSHTPTLRKKSSKKIIIASPSQELLHFLTLPNPAANSDPRERLHIVTPKAHNRSLSTHKRSPPRPTPPLRPPQNQDKLKLLRKKASECVWSRTEGEVRSNFSVLSEKNGRRLVMGRGERDSSGMGENCRLDYTFGVGQSWSCLQA